MTSCPRFLTRPLPLTAKPLDDIPRASALMHDGEDEDFITPDGVNDPVGEGEEWTIAEPSSKRRSG